MGNYSPPWLFSLAAASNPRIGANEMAERDSATDSGAGLRATGDQGLAAAKDTLKAGGGQAIDDARNIVRNLVEQQKHKVASRLGGVAQALHETAKNLQKQNAAVGRYADLAAERVDRVTQALNDRAIETLVEDAEDFARSQPILFIGGAMAAGFLLARVVRSGDTAQAPARSPSVAAVTVPPASKMEQAGGQL
jgi:ElaB/YqjD/DUF883 family membrane-anchored ribosome-binding protein